MCSTKCCICLHTFHSPKKSSYLELESNAKQVPTRDYSKVKHSSRFCFLLSKKSKSHITTKQQTNSSKNNVRNKHSISKYGIYAPKKILYAGRFFDLTQKRKKIFSARLAVLYKRKKLSVINIFSLRVNNAFSLVQY